VFAACLDTNGSGAQELLKSVLNPKAIELIQLDVRSDESVEACRLQVSESLKKRKVKLWAIVNNAGIWSSAHIEWGQMSDYHNVFEVNVFGLVRVTRAFLPLIRQNKGRVINVASIAGRIAGAAYGNYAMSKHAVVAFSCALRREMHPWGVKVSTIEPWIFKTPMADAGNLDRSADKEWDATPETIRNEYGQEYFDNVKKYSHREVERFGRNPEEVVDAMVDGITAVEPEIAYRVSGVIIGTIWTIQDLLPDCITDFIFSKLFYSSGYPKGCKK
jgi:NAD(P)-dependent dehydrogenase (short-subunit alcohol dehydrogenase family)